MVSEMRLYYVEDADCFYAEEASLGRAQVGWQPEGALMDSIALFVREMDEAIGWAVRLQAVEVAEWRDLYLVILPESYRAWLADAVVGHGIEWE